MEVYDDRLHFMSGRDALLLDESLDAADEAADFGRRRVGPAVTDARRNLCGVCGRWYPVILDLHRFFIAISGAVVNHDGNEGNAPGPVVWSAGALPKRRRLVHAVRDLAMLPGTLLFGLVNGLQVLLLLLVLRMWRSGPTPLVLVEWVAFPGSLHWPAGGVDLGVGGCHMLSCLSFMSFGLVRGFSLRRLFLGIFDPGVQFQCRLFRLVQALIFGAPVVLLVPCEVSLHAAW